MNIDGSGSHPLDSSTITSVESDFYSTLRGRLGFAHDHWLFYVTGGGILVHTDLSVDTSRGSSSHSAYLPGWAGGAGIEYAFNDRWSLKGEYLYYELENDPIGLRAASGNIPGAGFSRTFFEMRNSGYIARLGVNYHFGGPAPMSAPVVSDRGMMDKSGKNPVGPAIVATEPFNWTGPYAGVHFGYASGGLAWLDEPPDSNDNMAHYYQQGVFGGVQMGLNYQIHCLVLGLEGKFSGTGIDHQFTKDQNDEPNSFDTNIDWMGSLSLRAGFALPNILNGRLLAYAKGGISDVHQNYHWDHLDNSEEGGAIHHDVYNSDESRFGPMVGGGFEYAINDHWTAHLEYNYADYGSKIIHGLRSDFPLTETEAYESKLRLHMVEVGVNYKF
jgi:outer membrane immunogenic protein